ncbi:MAG: hypothetical protein AAF939_21030 [Planctomycetota bacterium]
MGNSSDLDDFVPSEEPQHSESIRKFAPWHKVRKEFVRREQWNKFIVRYAVKYLKRELQDAESDSEWSVDDEVEIPESVEINQPLKCLVIPGDDLLDIRSLHRDTESIQCYIRYLGFNQGHGSDQTDAKVHVAHNDVTSSSRVSNDSIVLHDPFQLVGNRNSQAYRYVKELGPFHVVNLDLCDSLFPNKEGDIQAYLTGLHSIAEYQMKEMATPWLLFLTTEVAPGEANAEQFDMLCRPTKENLQHTSFQEALSELIPSGAIAAGQQVDLGLMNETQIIDLFGVAIGKALLSFCSSAGQTWKIEMRGSHVYSINPEKRVSMLSLAFQFTPIPLPPQDATGLSNLQLNSPRAFDEAELASKLVRSVKKISDIDSILALDPELYSGLLESSADLLQSAGYDRDAYVRWVENGERE